MTKNQRSSLIAFLATVVVAGTAFIGLGSDIGQALLGHWSFVRSIENDRGTYYRLKVKLTYKGEPQDFDIVVGCNVHQINYKEGGRTYEVGLVPTVFGRRMSDGKAVIIRAPDACSGQTTANGGVEPDFLPLVVVYDDAKTLPFGTAYLSEDAYDSPLSVLTFGGATIEKATRRDFDEFRRNQTNVISRSIYQAPLGGDPLLKKMGLPHADKTWAHVCEGYQRYLLPSDIRALVDKYWPKERPRYWVPDDPHAEGDIRVALRNSKAVRSDTDGDPPHRFFEMFGPLVGHEADYGFPTRAGGGFVLPGGPPRDTRFPTPSRFPPAYYPATDDYRLGQWPADRSKWAAYAAEHEKFATIDIDFRNGLTRGFAYCFVSLFPDKELLPYLVGKGSVGRVDKNVIFSRPTRFIPSAPLWIFERDAYAFSYFRIYLESTRGDT